MASRKPIPSIKDHAKQGQLPIRTNSLYLGAKGMNVYLTYDQAVQVATNILKKAELLKGNEHLAVLLWSTKGSNKLKFGIKEVVQKGAQEAWE